jgi:hypothetical protein
MWKYLTALLVLLAMGGLGAAQTVPLMECTDCYSNIITQIDTQTIQDVRLGLSSDQDGNIDTVAVGNEGLSAAVIVTPESTDPAEGSMYSKSGFARIDQSMDQTISGLGSTDPTAGEGAKGITWNKAIQAAWILNQGQKELDVDEEGNLYWAKEGSYIGQSTTQLIDNIYDYDSREKAKVLNVDNKLAMIVDDAEAMISLFASADSAASDTQSSDGTITNNVDIVVSGTDP